MTDTTDPVEAVRVRGVVVSRPDARRLYDSERPIRIDVAGVAFAELTEAEALTIAAALGAVMPDEAAKLRADLKRADNTRRRAERYTRQAEAEAAESHAEVKQLEARLATMNAVQARHRAEWYVERDELLAKIEDALALCREIRPDSVLGTSPAVRLKLIEDRLTVVANPKPAESVQEVAK